MALSTTRRTPLDLVSKAGRIPTAAAALAVACAGAHGQQSQGGSVASVPDIGSRPITHMSIPGPSALASAEQGGGGGGQPGGEGPQVKVSDHMTVDLHVKDEDLASVLELLSIQTQKNIIASKNVSARVTATLYNVTFYEALDAILHVNGFGYIEQGNFIYVYTLQELEEIQKALSKRIAKVIHLNYLNAADAAEFIKPLISQGGEVKVPAKTDKFSIPEDAPGGADDYALGATLVVIDYEQNIEAVEKLLAELDTRPAQVLVEATVLQTALTEANAFGVDFALIHDLNFTDFLNIGGPRRAADSLILGGDGQTGGLSPTDNQGEAITSTPGNTDGPGTFKVGVIADDISIFVKMLDEVSDTTIISNPKILSLNRMPSRVLVGRRVGYLNTTSTETSTTQTVEFLDTGTQLYFRPFVSRDNTIRMELKPQVSEAIIREATDATGAAVSIPDEVTQEITTNVIVRDGQTVVLGGLFRESTQFTRRQVPLLGDIPIIGTAFRGQEDDTDRSEIIFMVTPTIVTDALMDAAAAEAMADVERLRAGSRQGLLPWSRDKMTAIHNLEAEKYAREGDYEKALWQIQLSLALNPRQPEAYRLRERITGEKEIWGHRSLLADAMGEETRRFIESVPPAPEPPTHHTPYGHHNVPRQPFAPPALGAGSGEPAAVAEPSFEPSWLSTKPARTSEPAERYSEAEVTSGGESAMFLDESVITETPTVLDDSAVASGWETDWSREEIEPAPAPSATALGINTGALTQPAAKPESEPKLDAVASSESKPAQTPASLAVAQTAPAATVATGTESGIPQPRFSPWFGGLTSRTWMASLHNFFRVSNPAAGNTSESAPAFTNVPTEGLDR